MAAVSWTFARSGNWKTAADWTGGAAPGSGDDVTVAAAGRYTVTVSKANAANSLVLDDAGATLADHGSLTVGTTLTLAAGALQLTGGGDLAAGFVDEGSLAGATGAVIVDGAGAALTTSFLVVGDAGAGRLFVTNGASVLVGATQPDMGIGQQAGSSGAVTVDGAGSSLTTRGNIAVGGAGVGTLSITGGAAYDATLIDIGFQPGGIGAVTVSGAASDIVDTGDLIVGDAGTGSLEMTDGGFVSVGSFFLVGFNSAGGGPGNSSGAATISDATLDVGFSGVGIGENGVGTLTLGTLGVLFDAGGATIGAAGRLVMNGGAFQAASLGNSGTIFGFGAITGPVTNAADIEANGGALVINGAFADTGSDTVDGGASLCLAGLGSTLTGSVTGAGTLVFLGGGQTIGTGASLDVANWSVTGGTASLNESLTYLGAFSLGAGAVLTVAGGERLTLSGPAALGGTLNGAGAVAVSDATLSGLTVGGTATLSVAGAATQTGTVTIGDATSAAASLSVSRRATYTIDAGAIARGQSKKSSLRVMGTLIRSGGAGVSVVAVKTNDTGSIVAAAGTLDFTGALTGTGAMSVNSGATLEVDSTAAANLSMTFNGGNGVLALRDPSAFAATVNGFAATDTIDLLGAQATSAVLGAGDTLVITNGANAVATLQLAGSYAGDTFNVASDGNGGTDITVSGAGAKAPAAAVAHQFIAAMSSFGAAAGGEVHAGHATAGPPPLLARPHAMTA